MDSNLNSQLDKTVAALSKNTPTPAGPTNSDLNAEEREELVAAINQLFAEFELVYHNQYNKAFNSSEKLHYARKLWFSNLSGYSAQTILAAGHKAIQESEFLPSVRSLLKHCEQSLADCGLKSPRQAYVEACQASSPKSSYDWSHPAVYYAGRDSDWYFLANNGEATAYPVFEQHYRRYCQQVQAGQQLSAPCPPQLPEPEASPLSREEQRKRMKDLRASLGI